MSDDIFRFFYNYIKSKWMKYTSYQRTKGHNTDTELNLYFALKPTIRLTPHKTVYTPNNAFIRLAFLDTNEYLYVAVVSTDKCYTHCAKYYKIRQQ